MGENRKYYFKEGEEVCHKEYPNQKLFVEAILKEVYPVTPKDSSNPQQTAIKILGIKCHWWTEDGKFMEGRFHKSELVPFEIAQGATHVEILNWLERNNSY